MVAVRGLFWLVWRFDRPPNRPPKMSTNIWIDKKGNTLRLRWLYEGKRTQLSLGVRDNPTGRAFANQKKSQIEMDIISGHYDPTLLKYKPRKLGTKPTEISAVKLFEKYTAVVAKDKGLTPGSMHRYRAIASKLRECLKDKPAYLVTEQIAKNAVALMSENLSGQTVKTYLFSIRACWDWAKGQYHLTQGANPWGECIDRVKAQPTKQLKPFTIVELQAIIGTFANHPQYCHYTEFVIFLAHTACRFGEAAGLRWQHLGADYATAWIGESISRGHQKGTKTGKTRTIQLSSTLQTLLRERFERIQPQPNDLVFTSPKGLAIDDHRFRARAWKTILASCQVEYRKPYNLRHSAISHALDRGANPIALAEQTGHDKRVLLSTYAHAIGRECLFVDIGKPAPETTKLVSS
jgi:integrase